LQSWSSLQQHFLFSIECSCLQTLSKLTLDDVTSAMYPDSPNALAFRYALLTTNLNISLVLMMILLVWQLIGWISYKQSTV